LLFVRAVQRELDGIFFAASVKLVVSLEGICADFHVQPVTNKRSPQYLYNNLYIKIGGDILGAS